jgi:hypothetical protein
VTELTTDVDGNIQFKTHSPPFREDIQEWLEKQEVTP